MSGIFWATNKIEFTDYDPDIIYCSASWTNWKGELIHIQRKFARLKPYLGTIEVYWYSEKE